MYHSVELVLVFALYRKTVPSVPHGDQVVLEDDLAVL